MSERRKKYDWLFVIEDWQLENAFRCYKKEHPKVKSEKRLARSFVKSKHIPLLDCYIKGQTHYFKKLPLCFWLED